MLLKKYILPLAILAVIIPFAACNSDEYTDEERKASSDYTTTEVKAFSLVADDSVLVNLDSVFFSIDQTHARIFNADSLPVGTDVTGLCFNIVTMNASAIDLIVSRAGKPDTIINYVTSTTATIDCTNPVQLRVTSANGEVQRTYTVEVNVHRCQPDSLYWSNTAMRALPTSLATPVAQKTVETAGRVYCLTTDAAHKACLAKTDNPGTDRWQTADLSLPFTPQVESLAAADGSFYLLDTEGDLWCSADEGASWQQAGRSWSNLYGAYGTDVFGLNGSTLEFYPSGKTMAAPADFPVAGTSQPVMFELEWMAAPQLYMVGGRNADGSLSRATWAFDGTTWSSMGQRLLPEALEGVTLVPYYSFRTNKDSWRATKYTTLFAMGGRDENGLLSRTVYMSYDFGMNWVKGPDLVQFPDCIPSFCNAQAVVASSTIEARSSSSTWLSMPDRRLPRWYAIKADSRAEKPITEWECPYIYLFGGQATDGSLRNTVWRGVINRLTFKPLQ